MNDPIVQLQLDIENYLLGLPEFSLFPVFKYKDLVVDDIQSENLYLADRSGTGIHGIGIQVRMPSCRAEYPNVPGPQLEAMPLIRVMENPTENNTGSTCEGVAFLVSQALNGVIFENLSNQTCQIFLEDRAICLKPVYQYGDRFAYDVAFKVKLPKWSPLRALNPGLVGPDQFNNISFSITDGATVYYTLDDSTPVVPTNGNAVAAPTVLYTGSFGVPAGTIVRWIAVLPGKLPSWVLKTQIVDT